MSNEQDDRPLGIPVHFVDGAVVADPQAPEIRVIQFLPLIGIGTQGTELFLDPIFQLTIGTLKEAIGLWMK